MAVTTINGYPYPDGSGAASIALYFQQLALAVDKRSVPAFPNDAARDAAIPSPTSGMVCVSGSRLLLYRAGAWAKQGGPRELLYANGNAGSSGVINVGAGPTGVLQVNVPAPGVAADTGHVHLVLGIKSTAATVGDVVLTVNGSSSGTQTFNIDSTATIPVVMQMPVTIPAATFSLAVTIAATAGNACSLNYSNIRFTF